MNEKLRWSRNVNWREDGEGLLLYHIDYSEKRLIKTFKFNKSAKKIWMLCDGSYTDTEKQILDYFKNLNSSLLNKVAEFIKILQKEDLITYEKSRDKKNAKGNKKVNYIVIKNPEIKLIKKERIGSSIDHYQSVKKLGNTNQFYMPIIAFLDITHKCNLRCKYCFFYPESKHHEEPSLSELKRIIDRIEKAGVRLLTLQGGEPFVRKDILDIIEYAYNKGLIICINTNATLLNKETLNKLRKISNSKIYFQINLSGTKKNYEFLMGKDTFDKTIENIKLAIKMGFRVEIIYINLRINRLDLPRVYMLCNKWGAETVLIFGGPVRVGFAEIYLKNFYPRLTELIWAFFFKKIVNFFRKIHILSTNVEFANCQYPICTFIHIDTEGNAHFCPGLRGAMPLGNILEKDLLEIWHSEEYKKLVDRERIGEPCKSCLFKKNCRFGCRAEIYAKTGDFFAGNTYCLRGKVSSFINKIIGRR